MAWPTVKSGEQAGSNTHIWARRIFPFALFLLALAPRLGAINRYITPDELLWVYRSIELREALASGRWADTLVAGHPGVTTTWLGATAISAQLIVSPDSRAHYEWLTRMAALLPDNVTAFTKLSGFLSGGRAAVAAVNSLAVVLIYLLVRRLWGVPVAVLAGVLLALDPFAAGLSGLLHVDALSASFATVALLALGLAAVLPPDGSRGRFFGLLAGSGVATGLAVLTKTPTIVLGGVAALGFVVWYWLLGGPLLSPERRRLLVGILVWGGAVLLTAVLLLPALWAAPGTVISTLSGNANRHLDEALRPTFFLGRVAFDHGPLFYPVALLWRSSPVVLAAVVPLGALLWQRRGTVHAAVDRLSMLPVGLLLVWVVLFLGLITVAAKKFDRYALPIIPALIILAAIVWTLWWLRRGRHWGPWLLVALQAVYLLAFIGYPLAAYNPLVGGPYTAVRVLPVGWGEGISTAGRWLTDQPGAANETAMAGVPPSLAPFFAGQTLVEGFVPPASARYTIHTLGGRQANRSGAEAQTAGLDLVDTIRYGGLDQAWIYRNPAPEPVPEPAMLPDPIVFAERLVLTAADASYADDVVHLTLRWLRVTALRPDERYLLRIVILDGAGDRWATQEADLLDAVYFYPPDWTSDDSGVVHTFLELTPAIPPDDYTIQVTVVDALTGDQLAARTSTGDFRGVAVPVDTVTIPRPEQVVSAARVQIPQATDLTWLAGSLQLLGTGELPAEALAGSRLPLDLFWHAPAGGLPAGLQVRWSLAPVATSEAQVLAAQPLSRLDTAAWRPGETINEKAHLTLPPSAVAGTYDLRLDVVSAEGDAVGEGGTVGRLKINNIDRVYELPPELPLSTATCFGGLLCLRGVDPAAWSGSADRPIELTLLWQAEAIPPEAYTVFTHVVDAGGATVAQADHWPGGLPTEILDIAQVITDRVTIDVTSLAPGTYDLRLGLYAPGRGERLPVTGSAVPAGPDELVLPGYITITAP